MTASASMAVPSAHLVLLAFLQRAQQRRTIAFHLASPQVWDVPEGMGVDRQLFRHFEQGNVADDLERRAILMTGLGLAPLPKCFKHVQAITWHVAHRLHAPEGAFFHLPGAVIDTAELGKGIQRFFPPPALLELCYEPVTQAGQVMGVHLGVGNLFGGERSFTPISALHALVTDDPKLGFENRGKPHLFPAKNAGGKLGIKDFGEGEAKVTIEQQHVVFRRMHNDLDAGRGQSDGRQKLLHERTAADGHKHSGIWKDER